MKFVTQLKEKANEVNHRDTIVMDLREAESRWVKSIQRNSFTEEYRKLLSGESVIHKGQLILYLNDDFVICCRGRLNQSDLPSNMKNPILLPTIVCLRSPHGSFSLNNFRYKKRTAKFFILPGSPPNAGND